MKWAIISAWTITVISLSLLGELGFVDVVFALAHD
jgi:hypothetical protein